MRSIHIAAAFICFATLHSITVSGWFKSRVARAIGDRPVRGLYRLSFTLLSVLTAGVTVSFISRITDRTLYILPLWAVFIFRSVQTFSVILVLVSYLPFDAGWFLGIRQALAYMKGEKVGGDAEGLPQGELVTTGAYGLVRHPMYLGGILFFLFEPGITINMLTLRTLAIAYFLYGVWIEDKRLVALFGDDYRKYMRRVPGIIPFYMSLKCKIPKTPKTPKTTSPAS